MDCRRFVVTSPQVTGFSSGAVGPCVVAGIACGAGAPAVAEAAAREPVVDAPAVTPVTYENAFLGARPNPFAGQTELIGVDLRHDPSTVAAAKSKGVTLVEGNVELDLSALRDDGHDFIILSQVIEHLREPGVALRALAQKLSPGGRLLIETPNVGGLDYHLFKRRYWGHWHIPRHLNLFTRQSLGELVTQSGLSVVELGYLPSPGPWILSLRNLLGLNSVKRTRGSLRSLGEFIAISNLFAVSAFTLLDFVTLGLGLPTSNQFLVAAKALPAAGNRERVIASRNNMEIDFRLH